VAALAKFALPVDSPKLNRVVPSGKAYYQPPIEKDFVDASPNPRLSPAFSHVSMVNGVIVSTCLVCQKIYAAPRQPD
jgi:hypothetical protein